jgi:hypothetical protein
MENSRKRKRDLRGESGDKESLWYGLRCRNSGKDDGAPGNGRLPTRFRDFVVESRKFRNSPTKRMKGISSEESIKLKGRSATVEVAGMINTNEPKKKRVTEADQNEQQYDDFRVCKPSPDDINRDQMPQYFLLTVGDLIPRATSKFNYANNIVTI